MSSDNLFAPEKTSTEKGGNSTPNDNNIFLVKQNSSGSREWIMDLGISDEESGISMTFDSSYNVYITGYTRNGLDGKKTQEILQYSLSSTIPPEAESGLNSWVNLQLNMEPD